MKYYVGIDLGGTNIVAGVVDEEYNIIAKASTKTNCPRPEKEIADDMARMAVEAVKNAKLTMDDIEWIGVGTPGIANSSTGIIEYSNNLGFKDTPMVKYIQESINKPVFIENDANAAAYGEYVAGAAKGAKNAVCITLGTGVGGGIIIDGKVVSGAIGCGGEIGHMVIEPDETELCGCGGHGHLEQYASATGVVRLAKKELEATDEESELRKSDNLTAKQVWIAAKNGDALALRVVDAFGRYLAHALGNIASVVDPEIFIIGGGMSNAGEFLLDQVKKYYGKNLFAPLRDKKFALAEFGNDAGIYGAAKLLLTSLE